MAMIKKNNNASNINSNKDNTIKVINWKNFKETAFELMESLNKDKLNMRELEKLLMKIYVKAKKGNIEKEDFKNQIVQQLNEDERFIVNSKLLK